MRLGKILSEPQSPNRIPNDATRISLSAIWFAGLCVLVAFGATALVRVALQSLDFYGRWWEFLFACVILSATLIFIPALRAIRKAAKARTSLDKGDVVQMRIATTEARDSALLTFGWGSFGLVALAFICFILTNDAAVGRTFFLLPLDRKSVV